MPVAPHRQGALNDGNKVGAVGGESKAVAEQHELLIGTHTAEGEQNYLMVATVNLPREDAVIDNRTAEAGKGEKAAGDAEVQASKKLKTSDAGDDPKKSNPEPSPKSTIIDAPEPASNYSICGLCSGIPRIWASSPRWRRSPVIGALRAISASRGAGASVVVVLDPRYRVDCRPQIS